MKKNYTLHTPTSKKLAKVFIHMCSFSLNSYPLKCVKLNLEGLVWETRTGMLQLFWPESNVKCQRLKTNYAIAVKSPKF